MNVWYISKYVSYPGHGYVGMRGFYLMQELSEQGCCVDLITSSASSFLKQGVLKDVSEISSTFSFHQLPGFQYRAAESLARVLSWLEFEVRFFFLPKTKLRHPDVIIVSSLSILSVVNGYIWSKVFGAKMVFEVRDIWPLTLIEEGGFSRFNPFVAGIALLERWGYKSSDLIVGTMPNLKAHVATVCKDEEGKVVCIPFGFPDNLSNPYFSGLSAGSEIVKDKFVLGYVGTIGKTNALETLFEALEKIDLVYENIECHIVGGGPLLDFYIQKYSHLENLFFRGHVDKKHVSEVMASFDALYFATFRSKVWEYGQSLNKLIDYMLAGKPVLASYSGFPSMIDEARCGWFVPAEDSAALAAKIKWVSNLDGPTLLDMGFRGREWLLENRPYSLLGRNLLTQIKNIHGFD